MSSSSDDTPPEQTEINLGRAAMSDAVGAAVRVIAEGGGPPPDADTLAAAQARARQMLGELSADDAGGLRDMQNLTLSIGLPATRAIFRQMVKASAPRGAAN